MSVFVALLPGTVLAADGCGAASTAVNNSLFLTATIVTSQAMGARCAVAADLDNDGLVDVVSASSTDNTVAWYRNSGGSTFSGKKQITYISNGARIATVGDIDGDGNLDVISASYYDHTVGWFKNDGSGSFSAIRTLTQAQLNAQGVHVADLDGDGDLDVVSASSGDNRISWYENYGQGDFCEIARDVDNQAIGARTVVSADIDNDGTLDLAVASKDDNTLAWFRNVDGRGTFSAKQIVTNTAIGAYSVVAADVNLDGFVDLVLASNGDDTVAVYYNQQGTGTFKRQVVYDNADFVLSVTAADFDRDGDIDLASASYFDGAIRWYENTDGAGTAWKAHVLYVSPIGQGHYVYAADMDADGDNDLIAVTMAENRVAVFYAATSCDNSTYAPREDCCVLGQQWNGTHCVSCTRGTYGAEIDGNFVCTACPQACTLPGNANMPHTCTGITGCPNVASSVGRCDCGENRFLSQSKVCVACPEGKLKPAPSSPRNLSTVGVGEEEWVGFREDECYSLNTTELLCTSDDYHYAVSQCDNGPFERTVTFEWKDSSACKIGRVLPTPHAFSCEYVGISNPYAITILVMVCVLTVLIIMVMALLWKFRSAPIFRHGQHVLPLLTICTAALVANVSLVFEVGEISYSTCFTPVALLMVSFSVVFGTLFTKSYRIWIIIQNPSFKRVTVSQKNLVMWLAGIVAVDVLLLIVWVGTDQVAPELVPVGVAQTELQVLRCYRSGQFELAACVWKATQLGANCLIAWKIRGVPDDYAEARLIFFCSYQVLFLSAISLPIIDSVADDNALVRLCIKALAVLLSTTFIVATMVGSRLAVLLFGKKVFPSSLNESSSGRSQRSQRSPASDAPRQTRVSVEASSTQIRNLQAQLHDRDDEISALNERINDLSILLDPDAGAPALEQRLLQAQEQLIAANARIRDLGMMLESAREESPAASLEE